MMYDVCYPSLKPETMPLNQGVKKKISHCETASSGIICKDSNEWSFDCEGEKKNVYERKFSF